MNVNEVITKLRVMLGAQEEVVTKVPTEDVKMVEAVLVDGTEVYTEGELAEGATLYVKVAEGEAPMAPQGMHETTDGLLITVGEAGVITAIEEKAAEAPAEAPAEEVAMEEEVTVEVPEEAASEVEAIVEAIAELIQPQTEVIEQLKAELETLKTKFSAFAEEPAGQPVKNTFSMARDNAKTLADARLENLIAIRKGKYNN